MSYTLWLLHYRIRRVGGQNELADSADTYSF
jgi:hypothetical protein